MDRTVKIVGRYPLVWCRTICVCDAPSCMWHQMEHHVLRLIFCGTGPFFAGLNGWKPMDGVMVIAWKNVIKRGDIGGRLARPIILLFLFHGVMV